MPPHAAQISERALLENRDFLRLLARKLVYDEHAAEDVVQQAWLAALERPPRYQGPLRAWLAGVVRNLATTHLLDRLAPPELFAHVAIATLTADAGGQQIAHAGQPADRLGPSPGHLDGANHLRHG